MPQTRTAALLFANGGINMGIGLIMPITTLYIHQDLHESLVTAGAVLMGFSLAMTLGNLAAGWAFDHMQPKHVLFAGNVLTVGALLALTLWPAWPLFAGLEAAYGLGLGILNAAMNGYIAFQQRSNANIFNQGYWIASVGMGIATASSGFLFHQGIRWVFGSAAALFTLTFAVIGLTFQPIERAEPVHQAGLRDPVDRRLLGSLAAIALLLVIIWIGYEQWNSNVSVLMLHHGISVEKYSLLFTVNTVEIILLQPVANRLIHPSYATDKAKVVAGGLLFGLSYLLIVGATAYWRFVLGMMVVTLGEILALTSAPSLINRYATDRNRGILQSLGSLSGSLGRAIGPLAGGALITAAGYNWTFLLLFAMHVVGVAGMLLVRPMQAESHIRPTES